MSNQKTEEIINKTVSSEQEAITKNEESIVDIKEPESEIDLLKKEVENYKNLYLRKSADFDNFRKQKDKQFVDVLRYSDEGVIKAILPILDDFGRALKNTETTMSEEGKKFFEGIKLIEQKIVKILEERKVKRIDAIGKKLDVAYHEALTQIEKDGVEPETILEVFEEGYLLYDKVIRHAKVVVAK